MTSKLPSSPAFTSIFLDDALSKPDLDGCCAGSCLSCHSDLASSGCHLRLQRPKRIFLLKCILLIVLVWIGIAVSLVLYYTFRQGELTLFRQNLHTLCQDQTKALQSSLGSISSIVYHYQGLYALALNQSRTGGNSIRDTSQWSLLATYSRTFSLVDRIVTLGYVNQSDRAGWESTRTLPLTPNNKIFYFPNYTDIDPVTKIVRTAPVPNNYSSIMLPADIVLPPVPKYDLTGWDFSTIPSMTAAITSAILSGTIHASNRSTLLANNNTFGILVFLPVYATPIPPSTPDERQAQTIGLVACVLPIGNLLIQSANTTQRKPIALSIYDRDSPSATSFLAQLPIPEQPSLSSSENASVLFYFGNRQYEMICTPSQDFVKSGYTTTPLFIALGTSILFIVNILLIILVCVYLSMRRAVQRGKYLSMRSRQNDAALKVLQDAAAISQQANQSKSDFLAFLCHEIRNPLHAIVAMINFLESEEDGPLTPHQREHIETVQASLASMTVIVNEALDLSNIEAGKLTFEVVPFALSEVMKSITISEQPNARRKGLTLKLNIDYATFPHVVYGDPTRFRQIVASVVSNAIKFTPHGSVTLDMTRLPDVSLPLSFVYDKHEFLPTQAKEAENATLHTLQCMMVEVKITDTGVGIAPEAYARLFEPYSQAKLNVMRMFGGTGLGLAIAKQLVDHAGGSISLASDVGKGTTVTIRIPFRLTPTQYSLQAAQHQPQPFPKSPSPLTPMSSKLEYHRNASVASAAEYPVCLPPTETSTPNLDICSRSLACVSYTSTPTVPICDPIPRTDILAQTDESCPEPDVCVTDVSELQSSSHSHDHQFNIHDDKREEINPPIQTITITPSNDTTILPKCNNTNGSPSRTHHFKKSKFRAIATSLTASTASPPLHRYKILIVDDSAANLKILCRMLHGHDLTTAVDGQQAVDAVCNLILQPQSNDDDDDVIRPVRQFDMIFTDIVMPVMDGLTSARAIRHLEQQHGLPPCPMVAVTANSFPQDKEACFQAGINFFISKPFNKDRILELVHTLTPRSHEHKHQANTPAIT